MDTKLHKQGMECAKEKVGFVFGLIVLKSENCGGITMLWKKEFKLEIMGYTRNVIDAIITNKLANFKWRIIGFYGHSEMHRR